MSIFLTLFFVSVYRITYVHRRLNQAVKYFSVDMPDRVAWELRLAYVWSPAYTTLRTPVQYLYRDAVSKSTHKYTIPPLLPRSFDASLPVMEKILIPFDFIADLLYQILVPVQKLPFRMSTPEGDFVSGSVSSSPVVGGDQHTSGHSPAPRPVVERMQRTAPAEAQSPWRESLVAWRAPIQPLQYERDSSGQGQLADPGLAPRADSFPKTTLPAESAASEADRMWGAVTVHNAPLYNQRGTRVRQIPSGSLVDVERLQDVSSGQIVHGTVWSRAGRFEDVILRRDDVDIYLGQALSSTTREQREWVSKRAEIIGAIEVRRKEIAEAVANRNPHYQDYRKVLMEYRTMDDESKKLKAEFDAVQGGRRMELANRLRVLKNEQQLLMPRHQDLKAKKEAWDDRNRGGLQNLNPESDPALLRLRRQLMEIDGKINNW